MLYSMDLLFAALALAAFAAGVYLRVRLWSVGAPGTPHDAPGERLGVMLRDAVAHVRILRERGPGLMHLGLFLGFVAPLLVALLSFLGLTLPDALGSVVSLLLDLIALGAVAALVAAAVRRYVVRPPHIERRPEDALVLGLLGLVLATGFLLEGVRMARTGESVLVAPAGWAVGRVVAAVTDDAAKGSGLLRYAWRVHFLLVLTLVALVPYTRLWHLVVSPLNVLLRDRRAPGVSVLMDLEDEDAETFGISRIDQYPRKDILDMDACTRCGRCELGCPAHLTDKPLNPRLLMSVLRDEWLAKGRALLGGAEPDEEDTELIETVVTKDVLWSCTNCRFCEEHCPVLIRHVDKLSELRRYLVLMESDFPSELKDTFKNIENNGNPWGVGYAYRADWTGDEEVPVLAEGDEAEVLFWVGCAGSFDERMKRVSRAMARLFRAAGVSFGILGTDESCCGDPARKTGNEYLFQMQAMQNVEALSSRRFRRIVTACPHCLNMLGSEYPQFDVRYEVVSHAEFLAELLRQGRLVLPRSEERFPRISYHDSCFLGRYRGVYDEPRELLRRAAPSAALVEADRCREKSFCCGAGGGRMWMEETLGSRINNARFDQLAEKKPDLLATACPYCLTMLDDARKDKGREDEVQALDVAEVLAGLLEEAAPAAGAAPAPDGASSQEASDGDGSEAPQEGGPDAGEAGGESAHDPA